MICILCIIHCKNREASKECLVVLVQTVVLVQKVCYEGFLVNVQFDKLKRVVEDFTQLMSYSIPW